MKKVKCYSMFIICIIWIFMSVLYCFSVGVLSALSIIVSLLCLFAAYDCYKRYKCYLVLHENYISINEGIINGFNTIYLDEIENINIKDNKVYIELFKSKKVIYLNLFDQESRNIILEYIKTI